MHLVEHCSSNPNACMRVCRDSIELPSRVRVHAPIICEYERYATLTCVPCTREISSFESPRPCALLSNPNLIALTLMRACVSAETPSSCHHGVRVHAPIVCEYERYATLTCVPCTREISTFESPRASKHNLCRTLTLQL